MYNTIDVFDARYIVGGGLLSCWGAGGVGGCLARLILIRGGVIVNRDSSVLGSGSFLPCFAVEDIVRMDVPPQILLSRSSFLLPKLAIISYRISSGT